MVEKEFAVPAPPPEFSVPKKTMLLGWLKKPKKPVEQPVVMPPLEIPPELKDIVSENLLKVPEPDVLKMPEPVVPPPAQKKSFFGFLKKKELSKVDISDIQAPIEPKKLEIKLKDLTAQKKVKAPPKPGVTDNLKKEHEMVKLFEKQMTKVNTDLEKINKELSLKKKQ